MASGRPSHGTRAGPWGARRTRERGVQQSGLHWPVMQPASGAGTAPEGPAVTGWPRQRGDRALSGWRAHNGRGQGGTASGRFQLREQSDPARAAAPPCWGELKAKAVSCPWPGATKPRPGRSDDGTLGGRCLPCRGQEHPGPGAWARPAAPRQLGADGPHCTFPRPRHALVPHKVRGAGLEGKSGGHPPPREGSPREGQGRGQVQGRYGAERATGWTSVPSQGGWRGVRLQRGHVVTRQRL